MPNGAMLSAVRVLSLPPGARRQASSPTPASLPGLVAWGEGSDLGDDGSAISSWLNRTGSGLDPANGTGGAQPLVKANAINGQKAAQFDGVNAHGLAFPAGANSWFQNVPGITYAAVFQPLATPANAVVMQCATGAGGGRCGLLTVSTTSYRMNARRLDADAIANVNGGTPAVGTPIILSSIADYANAKGFLYGNGTLLGSLDPMLTAGNTENTASTVVTLGQAVTMVQTLNGYLAAYAMWNVAYSAAQLKPVLQRWGAMYGISVA